MEQSPLYPPEKESTTPKQTRAFPGREQEHLPLHTFNIEELLAALRVLFDYREEEKNKIQETVLINIKTLLLPCIEALRRTRLDKKQGLLVDLIENRLDEIVSSYVPKFTSIHAEFTPKELQVALLVKDGKTTKEIASILGVSSRAIDFHRYNIRKKLGLVKSKQNLQARLLSTIC